MSAERPRALVVEDDRAWQQILDEILSDLGLAVDVAGSIDDAVQGLRTVAHRLAVVDLSLGGMDYQNQDGLRILEALQRHDPGCVAILLTGYATVELAVSALGQYGAFTCLRKETFRRAQFRDVLRQALSVAPAASVAALTSAALRPGSAEPEAALLPEPAAADPAHAGPPPAGNALLVEDDAGWRGILGELLAQSGYRVAACTSYAEALGRLRRQKHVLAVVDLSLASSLAPGTNADGYQVLAATRVAAIPTVVVSGFGTPAMAERAYAEHGIFAYLEKQGFDRAAFLTTIGEAAASRRGTGDALAMLTPREREVLALLAQGLTNKGIANALVISTNTVKRYLKTIFEKLDVDSRAAATAKAVNAGIEQPNYGRPSA